MNQLASKGSYLHSLAERCQAGILARAKKEPATTVKILSALIETHGYIQFDSLTKTKTLEKLISSADRPALEHIVKLFGERINDPRSSDDKEA